MDSLYNNLRYWNSSPMTLVHIDPRDAELDKEDSLSDRYAFLLGEEMGIIRFVLDQEKLCDDMRRGYQRGLSLPARTSDIYLRKLLNLRRNAYTRKIPVSSALTKDYLKQVTVTVCPVSGVALTQGTLTDTDWSIDRLDNSLGYVPGNLCIMSSRVNRLKDCLEHWDFSSDVFEKLQKDGPEALNTPMDNGLLVVEYLRLASLTAGPYAISRGKVARYMPFAQAPSACCTVDTSVAALHIECARTRLEGRSYAKRVQLFKRLGSKYWQISNRLVSKLRLALSKGVHPADVWFDGEYATLLRDLTDQLLAVPMTPSGITADEAFNRIKVSTSSLTEFARH